MFVITIDMLLEYVINLYDKVLMYIIQNFTPYTSLELMLFGPDDKSKIVFALNSPCSVKVEETLLKRIRAEIHYAMCAVARKLHLTFHFTLHVRMFQESRF